MIENWRDRRLKKWCLKQAIKIHDIEKDVIKSATIFYEWLKGQQHNEPFDIQKALIKHKGTIEEKVIQGF